MDVPPSSDSQLDLELKNVIDLVLSNDVTEMLECGKDHVDNTTEELVEDVVYDLGGQKMIHGSNEFVSLPDKTFQSRDDLVNYVREIGLKHGYVTVIKRSKADRLVVLGCDRGGTYRGYKTLPEAKKKKSASRLINCPFKILGRRKAEGLWNVEIESLAHNHEPSIDMSGHPYCRRFREPEVLRVKQMYKAGIQPRQILAALRQDNPNVLAVSRNIYSTTAKIRKESLAGRSVIQALLDEISEAGFTYNVKYDRTGCLTHLFFAHPLSVDLTKNYPHVFVMDCTYKTNKYKMPLLDIVGVTSFNTTFFSCFVFMQKEEQEDYVWALQMFSKLLGDDCPIVILTDRELALMNAIHVVFPKTANLLCVWHIQKNVQANCKGHFKDEVDWEGFIAFWNNLIQSPNESEFNQAWNQFEFEYRQYPVLLAYVRNTWLPWKERFVHAWTGQVTHFGNHATSRGEGAHAILKKFLQVSTGGLREVIEKFILAIQHQFQEIKTQLLRERMHLPQKLCLPFFGQLSYNVSFHALYELKEQYEYANSPDHMSQCKGHFFKTMGIPCFHMIREKYNEVLPLDAIHKQWRIDNRSLSNTSDQHSSLDHEGSFNDILYELKSKYEQLPSAQKENTKRQLSQILCASSPLIFEPTIQPHKGRPIGSKKRKETSSTKREPSLFERKEKVGRKCSICSQLGHNKSKCPSKENASIVAPGMSLT